MTLTIDPRKTHKIPRHYCYACDEHSIGVTLHNGEIRAACKRHADPKIKAKHTCMYCDGFVRAGGLDLGAGPYDIVHKKCYAEDQKRN